MSLDKFLDFLFKHNVVIIEGLFVFILLLISALAFYYFFSSSKEGVGAFKHTSDSEIEKLQIALKQVLEKANLVTAAGAASTGGTDINSLSSNSDASGLLGADLGNQVLNLQQEISTLKDSLTLKQKEIENYKNENLKKTEMPASADPNQAGLEDQIKELQAKLTEYEIISQDIADLTMYKDENAKLKWELSKLKGEDQKIETAKTEVPAPVAPAAVESAPEVKTEPAPNSISPAESVATTEASAASATTTEVVTANTEEVKGVVDDVLMAEFAAAVEEQNKGKTVNHTQVKQPADPAKKETEESKIMDQFEKFVKKEGAS